jgi:hypothetical protein
MDPVAPKLTYDFVMSQLRTAAVAVVAYAGGRGWLTPTDAGLLTALGASLGPILLPWAWSVYANLGMIHVHSGSSAATVAKIEAVEPIAAAAGAALATAKAS